MNETKNAATRRPVQALVGQAADELLYVRRTLCDGLAACTGDTPERWTTNRKIIEAIDKLDALRKFLNPNDNMSGRL